MSAGEEQLVPYTEILQKECPRLRILVVGKSGAGKSALINAVFGSDVTPVVDKVPGDHDIEKELTLASNDRIIIHDSKGFEGGEEKNLQKVFDFIDRRSKMPALKDQIHAIWICAEIPFAGSRLFEKGVERLLKEFRWDVPIIVLFTKLDILRQHRENELEQELERRDEEMEDTEFEARLDNIVDAEVEKLCIKPLHEFTRPDGLQYHWIKTSINQEARYKKTIADLVDVALELTKVEDRWIEMAIAQRSSAKSSIEASVKIGRKRYWRGLFSDLLAGVTMIRLLDVLQRDIVNVWNLHDPEQHLIRPEFLALLSVLVEDLSGEQSKNNYPLTERAIQSIIDHPTSVVVAGPTAIVVLFAEWVRGTYNKTKSSVRCLIAFIVDLTLTMDTLFYLVLSRGKPPLKIGHINEALRIYKTRKTSIHTSIKTWTDLWGAFSHLEADKVISKIADIITEYSVKPEKWEFKDQAVQEHWMTSDELRKI
ncbi:hypothetical protein M422DRAFT_31745 [Sphaerobolus stellatus SS14]|uniref:Unplaced genomic scaffold SPHSTscaffold_62, whole genome shotgun sequence n=1 Tax=Sphaerobolus stellatus (strain SS14) TaxID=990650 RepID=A0A0C9V302_SPHS4|nr:hypothetical protein M422DRAFT_31745 [Sphaerobolus stellatus SS14]